MAIHYITLLNIIRLHFDYFSINFDLLHIDLNRINLYIDIKMQRIYIFVLLTNLNLRCTSSKILGERFSAGNIYIYIYILIIYIHSQTRTN